MCQSLHVIIHPTLRFSFATTRSHAHAITNSPRYQHHQHHHHHYPAQNVFIASWRIRSHLQLNSNARVNRESPATKESQSRSATRVRRGEQENASCLVHLRRLKTMPRLLPFCQASRGKKIQLTGLDYAFAAENAASCSAAESHGQTGMANRPNDLSRG